MKKVFAGILLNVVIWCVATPESIFAQEKTLDQTLDFLNRTLQSNCSIEIEKWELIIKYYRNGNPLKEDRVNVDALDPNTVEYLPNEKIVSVKCRQGLENCIYRKTFVYLAQKKKIVENYKGYYSRLYFIIDKDEKTVKQTVDAVKDLLNLAQGFTGLSFDQEQEAATELQEEDSVYAQMDTLSMDRGFLRFKIIARKQMDKRPLSDIAVKVIKNSNKETEYRTSKSGKLTLKLAFYNKLVIKFEHPGYIPMHLEINTRVPAKRTKWIFTYNFAVPFVEENAININTRAFEEPIAKVRHFSRPNKFKDDQQYLLKFERDLYGKRDWKKYKQIQKKLKKLEKKNAGGM